MPTCGDLDGKPCEWWNDNQEAKCCFGTPLRPREDGRACLPMLALLEARKEATTWKQLVEMRNKQLSEDFDKIKALESEVVRWREQATMDGERLAETTRALAKSLRESAKWERVCRSVAERMNNEHAGDMGDIWLAHELKEAGNGQG